VIGAGYAPAGAFPAGFGTPSSVAGRAGNVLVDETGAQHGARYINPKTRRYELDATGRYKGMNNVSQLVEMAFLTVRGSSVLPGLGMKPMSGVIGRNFVARQKQAVKEALAFLTNANVIELVSVDVDVSRKPSMTLIRWRDLSTSQTQERSFTW